MNDELVESDFKIAAEPPGAPQSVVATAMSIEVAKLVTTGWPARCWPTTALPVPP